MDIAMVITLESYQSTGTSHHQCQTFDGDAGAVMGGGGLRVSKMGKLQGKGKFSKFLAHSGDVHVNDCCSTHCCGCMAISAQKAC